MHTERWSGKLAHFCLFLATFSMLASATMLRPTPAFAQKAAQVNAVQPALSQVLDDINRARTERGLHTLQIDPALVLAAQAHVADMVTNANYSHTGSDGSSVRVRANRAGYPAQRAVSENWVAVSNPAGALQWWMNSTVHRNNILNGKWNAIGVGAQVDPRNGMTVFVAVFGGDKTARGGQTPKASDSSIAVTSPPADGKYAIRSGDTLLAIALRFGVTWESLATANGLSEHSLLQVGQILKIPGASQAAPAPAPAAAISAEPYMVQQGDTLSVIAQRYGISWQRLAAHNSLGESSVLQVGQIIQVPLANSAASPENGSRQASLYQVRDGDTIISIAVRHGLDWKTLLRINALGENDVLAVGQEIRLR